MNTPPLHFSLPELDVRELDIKLRQVTPEIDFPHESAHSNRWSAELAAHGLEAAEIDCERHKISDKSYWQLEALTLVELYLQQSKENRSEVERWRNICIGMESILNQQNAEVDKPRRLIDNEEYWKLEAACLKQYAARLENKLLDDFLANANGDATATATANGQKLPSPCSEIERHRKPLRQYHRQRRSHREIKAGRCHGMALRSSTAKVAKRRDLVGGKPRQSSRS